MSSCGAVASHRTVPRQSTLWAAVEGLARTVDVLKIKWLPRLDEVPGPAANEARLHPQPELFPVGAVSSAIGAVLGGLSRRDGQSHSERAGGQKKCLVCRGFFVDWSTVSVRRCRGVRGGVDWTVRSERRRWPKAASNSPRLRPLSHEAARVKESEEGSKEERGRSRAAAPSTGWPHPR